MPPERNSNRPQWTPEEMRLIAQLVLDGASSEMSVEEASAITAEYAADPEDPRSTAAVEALKQRGAR